MPYEVIGISKTIAKNRATTGSGSPLAHKTYADDHQRRYGPGRRNGQFATDEFLHEKHDGD